MSKLKNNIDELDLTDKSTLFGFRLALTAATITLADNFAFSEEWINAWTLKTIATAQLILQGLAPTEDNTEKLIKQIIERASQDKPITSAVN